MTKAADIKLLPLPEHTEAGEFTFDAHVFEHMDMVSYARANVAHATAAKDAEIERLRTELSQVREAYQRRTRDMYAREDSITALREEVERWRILHEGEIARRMDADDCAERLAEALRFYADTNNWVGRFVTDPTTPAEEDGGDNARESLRDHDQDKGGEA